ncbi:MAG: hypothetical protein QXV17_14010 [Candidatus Micrarchaeaceae archaeon]
MITLDDFLGASNKFVNLTKREWKMADLPIEIRKDPKKYIEKVKTMNLSADQLAVVQIAEEGSYKYVIEKKKKVKKRDLEPYNPYALYCVWQMIRRVNNDHTEEH